MATFEIYKRGQGKYTRILTFICAMVIAIVGAKVLSEKLDAYSVTRAPTIRFGVPTGIVVVLGLVVGWFVNRPGSADFLIATESEMKKVSWTSKKEIIGSTKVVIITAIIMAAILFSTDMLFTVLFKELGIMGASGAS